MDLNHFPKSYALRRHLDDDDDTSNFRLFGYSNIEVKNRNNYGGRVMIQVHENATINKTDLMLCVTSLLIIIKRT